MTKSVKLSNSPLREAIFELYWNVPTNELGVPVDSFPFLDSFKSDIKEAGFPTYKSLFKEGDLVIIPSIQHQFWKGEVSWPVVQLGHGLFAFNDVGLTYEWDEKYFPLLKKALTCLDKASLQSLNFQKMSLKYINAVDLNMDDNFINFITQELQTNISNNFNIDGSFKGVNLLQSFDLKNETILSVGIQTVINNSNNKPAVIWNISAERNGIVNLPDIVDWVEYAHENISNVFYNMISKNLYGSFK